jgi:hypothetical protein
MSTSAGYQVAFGNQWESTKLNEINRAMPDGSHIGHRFRATAPTNARILGGTSP